MFETYSWKSAVLSSPKALSAVRKTRWKHYGTISKLSRHLLVPALRAEIISVPSSAP